MMAAGALFEIPFDNVLVTTEQKRERLMLMLDHARVMIHDTVENKNMSVAPFVVFLTEKAEYYLEVPSNVIENKLFSVIGSVAKELNAMAMVFVMEAYGLAMEMKDITPEIQQLLDDIKAGKMAVHDTKLAKDMIVINVMAYDDCMLFPLNSSLRAEHSASTCTHPILICMWTVLIQERPVWVELFMMA